MDKAANDALRAENARLKDELSDAISARETHARSASEIAQRVTLLEAMLETIPVGVVLARIPDGRIIMGNSRVEEMLRHPVLYSTDAKSYGEWVCFHEDGRRVEDHEYPLSRIICCGENYAELDVQYQRGDETRPAVLADRPARRSRDSRSRCRADRGVWPRRAGPLRLLRPRLP